jgi:AraC-like DNA-binding protein
LDPFGRLYCVREGEGVVVHHDRMFHLRPGYLFVIPAHAPGRYRAPKFMSLTWLHFSATLFGSLEPFAALGWPFVVKARDRDVRETERLIRLHGQGGSAAVLEADGILRQLLSRFAGAAPVAKGANVDELPRLHPVLVYIEHNLARRLTLAELARVVHLQPTYFSNLFSKHMGVPPMQFLNRRRVERAAAQLFQGKAMMEEIAKAVGFLDVHYFSRTFKRFMGLSPSQYRAQIRAEA